MSKKISLKVRPEFVHADHVNEHEGPSERSLHGKAIATSSM
ncbi:MAG: hypothetical protein AB4042_11055 [Leptolyngbyaceae cyanobacterium]